jgi:hypothetical protein
MIREVVLKKHLSRLTFIIALSILFFNSYAKGDALDEYYINSTTYLSYSLDNGSNFFGTGFFIFRQTDNNVGQVFLITNKHVLPKEGKQRFLSVRVKVKDNDDTKVVNINIEIVGADGKYVSPLKVHPNKDYDVAAIHVTQVINQINIKGVWIPYDLLATKDMMKAESITIGSEIFLLGYPDAIYDERNIFPVLRKGNIATVPSEGYSFNQKLIKLYRLPKHIDGFLVDANVFPGSSGSLVILRQQPNPVGFRGRYGGKGPKNIPYVLGIVSGSLPIYDTALMNVQRMGLGIAYSSDTIKETIEQFYKK